MRRNSGSRRGRFLTPRREETGNRIHTIDQLEHLAQSFMSIIEHKAPDEKFSAERLCSPENTEK